jgi:hypothetical protein
MDVMKIKKEIFILLVCVFLVGCGAKEQENTKDNEETTTISTTTENTEEQDEKETGLYGNMRMVDSEGNTRITVYDLKDAEVQTIQDDSGQINYVVMLYFTEEGTKKFAEVTTELVGETLNIEVDNQVICSPMVMCAVVDGETQITGLDSFDEAENIVTLIRGDKDNPATFDEETEETEYKSETETTDSTLAASEETSEQGNVEHREEAIGISDKKLSDIYGTFSRNKVNNDVTGKWRVSTIVANVSMEDYAYNYYERFMLSEGQVEAVINFNYNTSTSLSVYGNFIDVCVYDYVDGEEHDANLMFTGTLLKEYYVYTDNGDIVEIQ